MRPLVYITVGYIIGIIWGLYLKVSIAPILFIIGIVILFFVKWGKLKEYRNIVVILLISALISNIQILYLENKYENLYEDEKEISIVGTVISEKEETTYKNKYTIKVVYANNSKKYSGTNLIIYTDKDVELDYADTVRFSGIFSFPDEATNYKAFDYREYLKTKNIYGIVTVSEEISIIKKNNLSICYIISNNLRTKIKENLKEILGENASLVLGMILGDTSELSDETIENFKTSSMYHILAVSGTHVRIYNCRINYTPKQNKSF